MKRTWAPRGQTPIHYHTFSKDKISAISALTLSPKRRHLGLYAHFWQNNLSGEEVEIFLKYLFQHLRGAIVLLWDRASIHKNERLRKLFESNPRVQVEEFPAYAPELNPAEYVWNQSDSELSNTAPEDLSELERLLTDSIGRTGKSQKLLWACIYASDLPLEK